MTEGGAFLFAFLAGIGCGAAVGPVYRGLLRWAVSVSRQA